MRASADGRTRTALVVGAGVGGLAAAILLARQGCKVRVLEKNATAGGRCQRLQQDGFTFDTGPTMWLMPEVYEQVFAAMGERLADHVDLQRLDPAYRVFFPDGRPLDFSVDLARLAEAFERIEPGAAKQLARYLEEGRGHYDLSLQEFLGRDFRGFLDFFNPRMATVLVRLKALTGHHRHVGRFFKHPGLKAAMTFQHAYVGTNPFRGPATFSLFPYAELVRGVWYPRGGMTCLVEALLRLADRHGVTVSCGTEVAELRVDGNRVVGAELADGGLVGADCVVANADVPYVYDRLLPDAGAAAGMARRPSASSVIAFYWGLDTTLPGLQHHNIFLSRDDRTSFRQIERDHTVPDAPTIYVNVASRTDSAMAPPGRDAVTAMVPVGHLQEGASQDWASLTARARRIVLARLAEHGFGDLEPRVILERICTPPDWRDRYHVAKGAVFGSLSHYPSQMGYLRPANQHPRYRNLFFVGGSTRPGCGVPLVLMSARLAADRVARELGARAGQA